MKKLLGLLAVAPMAITACGSADSHNHDNSVRLGVFSGPTGLGAAKLSENKDLDLIVRDGADAFSADIAKCDFELVTVPADQAWTLHNNEHVKDDCGLQVAAVVASNMLQFMTPEGGDVISTLAALDGKEVFVPASPTVLAIVNEIMGLHTFTVAPTITGKSAADIIAELSKDNSTAIGILPEPAVTAQVITNSLVRGSAIIDVTDASPVDRPIGVLAVNQTWAENNPTMMTGVMAEYAASAAFMTNPANITEAAKLASDNGIAPSAGIATQAIPNAKIQWDTGATLKTSLDSLLLDLLKVSQTELDAASDFYFE